MSGSAYHWDALRKERILQRKREALRRLQNPDPVIDNTGRTKKREEPLVIADQGEFVNLRNPLPMFRVKKEGHDNRYRNRQSLAPHCDKVFPVIYPGTDNADYICDQNRTNRRMNVMMDRYDVARRVNGDFHIKVLESTPV
ncbi:uncharacterized protein LOC121378333 isoform X5 [Gigantopelta aegis]|uniref:uncharacterized protein LOC121378333 isoform X5 n=1 Tax=Gigantopelta aegis TaxID=1735272 RepID=UPI001B888871|nr:uncharacterized protein LOC121378333 isoform X5 [Gigantopelta aegis]